MINAYVSLDLGGTKIACALADEGMEPIAETSVATESHLGAESVLQRMTELVESELAKTDAKAIGIGVGAPGLVDINKGHTRFLPNFPSQWRDVAVGPFLKERIGCDVHLLNDARAATLGELHFGVGREGAVTFAYFGLGTGVGGGVVVNRKLLLGPFGSAGELGHQTVLPNGPECGCGNRGCLEAVASGSAIAGRGVRLVKSGRSTGLRDLVEGDLNRINASTMAQAAGQGDEVVAKELDELGGGRYCSGKCRDHFTSRSCCFGWWCLGTGASILRSGS